MPAPVQARVLDHQAKVLHHADPGGAQPRRAGVVADAELAPHREGQRSQREDLVRVRGQVLWGVGIDPNIVTASLKAVVSAVNRALRTR